MTTEQKTQFIIGKAIEANPSIKDRNSRTLENGMVETCFCAPKISLEDVLMAIHKKHGGEQFGTVATNGWFHFQRRTWLNGRRSYWTFGKHLTEQSEELKNFVYEILK